MILLKGFIEIGTGQTEAEIRESINELLKQRFPLVRPDHFDFVKRDRNKVTTPVVNESLKWDYKHLKQLCGQGKIYVRLNISRECIDMTTDSQSISSDEDEDLPTFPSSNITKHTSKKSSAIAPMPSSVSNQHDVVEIVHESVNPPSSSNIPPENGNTVAGSSVATRSQIDKERLCELLPFATEAELEGALSEFGAIDSAANALLRDPNIPAADENMEEGDDLSFVGITSKLGKKLTGKRKKLEIDEDDLVSDAIAYYKSIEIDAHCPLRITYASQPAIDSGGILRQFYSDLFDALAEGKLMELFEGEINRKVPSYRPEAVMSGLLEMIGKMIAHSLAQGGPGFPFLARPCYYYLVTGDIMCAMAYCDVWDIPDTFTRNIALQVQ